MKRMEPLCITNNELPRLDALSFSLSDLGYMTLSISCFLEYLSLSLVLPALASYSCLRHVFHTPYDTTALFLHSILPFS